MRQVLPNPSKAGNSARSIHLKSGDDARAQGLSSEMRLLQLRVTSTITNWSFAIGR